MNAESRASPRMTGEPIAGFQPSVARCMDLKTVGPISDGPNLAVQFPQMTSQRLNRFARIATRLVAA